LDTLTKRTNKYVCEHCFGDSFIKQYIREHGNDEAGCDYCSREGKTIPFSKLYKEVIKGGIEYEYRLAEDEGVEDDDSYTKMSTEELVFDVLSVKLSLDFENCEKLMEDLVYEIEDNYEITGDAWVDLEDLVGSEYDEYQYSWNSFSEKVKHRVRYFFRSEKKQGNNKKASEEFILNRIAALVNENRLVKPLRKNKKIFRARENNEIDTYLVNEIGPPRPENTISNRMSPPGIVMFYGALDYKTTIKETICKSTEVVTVGTFKLLEDIQVLDLTKKLEIPSLFDKENRHKRSELRFLKEFAEESAKPINKGTKHHFKYVPTQVMAEYFRYIYKTEDGKNIQGIMYPSSKIKNGVCVVLFFNIKNCKLPSKKLKHPPTQYLELIDTPQHYKIESGIKISKI